MSIPTGTYGNLEVRLYAAFGFGNKTENNLIAIIPKLISESTPEIPDTEDITEG